MAGAAGQHTGTALQAGLRVLEVAALPHILATSPSHPRPPRRTNVAQFTYGMLALGQQLHALGIAGARPAGPQPGFELAARLSPSLPPPAEQAAVACSTLPERCLPPRPPCPPPPCPAPQRARGWTRAAAWRGTSWTATRPWATRWRCSTVGPAVLCLVLQEGLGVGDGPHVVALAAVQRAPQCFDFCAS